VMDFPSYPARPTNGGALECALPKVGKWAWQPKVADWRGLVHPPSGRVWNRHGKRSTVEGKLTVALDQLRERLAGWLDVGIMERNPLMRGCIIVFDFLPVGDESLTYDERRESLEKHSCLEIMPELWQPALIRDTDASYIGGTSEYPMCNRVFLIRHFVDCDPLKLYQRLKRENEQLLIPKRYPPLYEGLVAKRRDKPYPMQLRGPEVRTPWMIKHRFDQ
jgi:hypothetical protein